MATPFKCSRCGSVVTVEEGQTEIICPGCRGRARVPALTIAPPVEIIRPSLPPVVIHEHDRPRRMPSHGWFTRSFALTTGGCSGIVLCAFASCAGLLLIARDIRPNNSDAYRADAIEKVLTQLRKLKIDRLENGAAVSRKESKVVLAGNGLDAESRLHSVAAEWTVSDFGDKRIWQLETLIVDQKIVFSRELSPSEPSDL